MDDSSYNSDATTASSLSSNKNTKLSNLNWNLLLQLMDMLAMWNLEDCIEEVIFNIFGAPFEECRRRGGINHWNKDQLLKWLSSLSFVGEIFPQLEQIINKACIDGEIFTIMCKEKKKNCLALPYTTSLLINTILLRWASCINYTLPSNLPSVPLGVLGGYICDLRELSKDDAKKLIEANQRCCVSGEGYIYGQLIAIGYTEYRMIEKKWFPYGLSNSKFILRRRKLPNGVSQNPKYTKVYTSTTCNSAVVNYGSRPIIIGDNKKGYTIILKFDHPPPSSSTGAANPNSSSASNSPLLSQSRILSSTFFQSIFNTSNHANQNNPNSSTNIEDYSVLSYLPSNYYNNETDEFQSGKSKFAFQKIVDGKQILSLNTPQGTNLPNKSSSIDQFPSPSVLMKFQNNPLYDEFQIGRAPHSTNDFVIPGQLHLGEAGTYTGPVSRWACRIVCERLPPYKSYIYAGAYNDWRELQATGVYVKSTKNSDSEVNELPFDGFTTYGIKIRQPEIGEWLEVSVFGNTYYPRSKIEDLPNKKIDSPLKNVLTNGTLIDICGIILMYQDPITMAKPKNISDPLQVIEKINNLKPQCPVLLTEIKFSYTDSLERAKRVIEQVEREDSYFPSILSSKYGPIHIPFVDYSEINEENRSYVFPSCGHVHGYHKSMEGRSCPLCRQEGPFVPIAFSFEPTLCSERPTHVFNPCGHVASLKTCIKWSKIYVISKNLNDTCSICPFCGGELSKSKPFSRLILQTESKMSWSDINSELKGIDESSDIFSVRHQNLSIDSSNSFPCITLNNYNNKNTKYNMVNVNNLSINDFFPKEYVDKVIESQKILFLRERQNIQPDFPIANIINDSKNNCESSSTGFRYPYYPTFAPQLEDL